jgi:hypothetical protein
MQIGFLSLELILSIAAGPMFAKVNKMLVVRMRGIFFDRLALFKVQASARTAIKFAIFPDRACLATHSAWPAIFSLQRLMEMSAFNRVQFGNL